MNNNRAIGSSTTECPICGHLFKSTDTFGIVSVVLFLLVLIPPFINNKIVLTQETSIGKSSYR